MYNFRFLKSEGLLKSGVAWCGRKNWRGWRGLQSL